MYLSKPLNIQKSKEPDNLDAESPEILLSTLFTGKKSCTYRVNFVYTFTMDICTSMSG